MVIDFYLRLAPPPRDPIEVLFLIGPRFPRLFGQPTPLALGIHLDLAKRCPDVTSEEINKFLGWWTGTPGYLESVVRSGAVRRNLAAKTTEPVSNADRMVAAMRLLVLSTEDAAIAARLQAVTNDAVLAALSRIDAKLAGTAPHLAAPCS